MIYTPKNCPDKKVVDCMGVKIPYVFEFNDETCEVKFYIRGINARGAGQIVCAGESLEKGLELVKCSAIIPGAKLVAR